MKDLEQALFDFAVVGRETIGVPEKPTCTSVEASKCTGISERQIRNWVEDGTLLAINSAREPIAAGKRKRTERERWRIVVRRPPNIPPKGGNTFLTLEELIGKISNINAD